MELFSVLLAKPDFGDINALAKVFELSRGITRDESLLLVRRSWGFVAENVSMEEAERVSKICRENGIDVVSIPAAKFASIPKPETFTKAGCSSDGFMYTVEHGEGGPGQDVVPWDSISVVAAAPIKEQKVTVKVSKEGPSIAARAASMGVMMTTGIPLKIGKTKEVKKETIEFEIVFYLELFFKNAPYRIRMRSDRFDFSYLGGRKGYSTLVNFNTMLADIDSLAAKAVKNRGFRGIVKKETLALLGYDSIDYFEKECRWLIALNGQI